MPFKSPTDLDAVAAMQTMMQFWQSIAPAAAPVAGMPPIDFGKLAAVPGIDLEALTSVQATWSAKHAELWQAMIKDSAGDVIPEAEIDRRFSDPAWKESPLSRYLRQAYLINSAAMHSLADVLPAETEQKRKQLKFFTRQLVDAAAPSNFAVTNPEFIKTALATEGESIRRGLENLLADLGRGHISMTDESQFEVGRNIAATPGQVVYENELIQLIQYSPTTKEVSKRPFLIVPPCINKFYILDLQPENSFVRYVVDQGNTVFLVSWRNVKEEFGHLTWDDYLELGPLTALSVVREISGQEQANALGFCVGGTILSAALAVANDRGEDPVASLTLLTTLLDFEDSGEIGHLVDESMVAMRESTIGKGGVLRGAELATTFSALRANDLIWQYVVNNYLKGNTPAPFDLLYWNSDATNLPGPFIAWYLRNLYLENKLRVPGSLAMCGEHADLGRVAMPTFIYASREDHIVPWRSAYMSRHLLGGDTTFVLGASGHIAGVINPPAKNKRNYWTNALPASDADQWLEDADEVKGSWWPAWADWLAQFSDGKCAAPKSAGGKEHLPLEPAPGSYVRARA